MNFCSILKKKKKGPLVNIEVLVHLKNIESPEYNLLFNQVCQENIHFVGISSINLVLFANLSCVTCSFNICMMFSCSDPLKRLREDDLSKAPEEVFDILEKLGEG